MILRVESDASYLTEPGAHSRGGGHHYLRNLADSPAFFNGAILNIAKILRKSYISNVLIILTKHENNSKSALHNPITGFRACTETHMSARIPNR
jgi:hypothetical protein